MRLDRDLAQVVDHLTDEQRLKMAKQLARRSSQLRAYVRSTANLDHDLFLTVANLTADERFQVAKKLARWARQLEVASGGAILRQRSSGLPRLKRGKLALN